LQCVQQRVDGSGLSDSDKEQEEKISRVEFGEERGTQRERGGAGRRECVCVCVKSSRQG